jgi:hypothetical protein
MIGTHTSYALMSVLPAGAAERGTYSPGIQTSADLGNGARVRTFDKGGAKKDGAGQVGLFAREVRRLQARLQVVPCTLKDVLTEH